MKLRQLVCLLALVCVLPVFVGCGSGRVDQYDMPGESKQPTAKETVTGWLKGVAESGQLDSGAEVMGEQVDKLAAEGIDIKEDFQKLMKSSDGAPLKEQANKILEKLGTK